MRPKLHSAATPPDPPPTCAESYASKSHTTSSTNAHAKNLLISDDGIKPYSTSLPETLASVEPQATNPHPSHHPSYSAQANTRQSKHSINQTIPRNDTPHPPPEGLHRFPHKSNPLKASPHRDETHAHDAHDFSTPWLSIPSPDDRSPPHRSLRLQYKARVYVEPSLPKHDKRHPPYPLHLSHLHKSYRSG